jgi:hypothetical protein
VVLINVFRVVIAIADFLNCVFLRLPTLCDFSKTMHRK